MKKSVYLDSTIPSYLFDERENIKTYVDVTKRWWEEERQRFDVWISEETIAELSTGDYPNKTQVIECVSGIPVLSPNVSLVSIAKTYLKNYLMPRAITGDAFHLAYASYYKYGFSAYLELQPLDQCKQETTHSDHQQSHEPFYAGNHNATRALYGDRTMITTPLLEQKYRAQKQLNEEAGHDIQTYFELSHRISGDVEKKYGFKFKYGRLPGGELELVEKQTKSVVAPSG